MYGLLAHLVIPTSRMFPWPTNGVSSLFTTPQLANLCRIIKCLELTFWDEGKYTPPCSLCIQRCPTRMISQIFFNNKPLQSTIQYNGTGWNLRLSSDLRCFKLHWPISEEFRFSSSESNPSASIASLPPKKHSWAFGHCKQLPLPTIMDGINIPLEETFSVKVVILNQLPLPLSSTCSEFGPSFQHSPPAFGKATDTVG